MTDLALLVGPTLGWLAHEAIDAIKTRPRIRRAIRESYRAWIGCMVGRAAGLAHAVGASIPAPQVAGCPSLRPTQGRVVMVKRIIAVAMLALVAVVALGAASAFGGGGGRLQLYLVNSGPDTRFYNDSAAADGNCNSIPAKAASLSLTPGTSLQQDNPYGSSSNLNGSVLSYTVPAGGGFTIKSNDSSIMLKIWSFSGDGTCPDQGGDQSFLWSVDCAGPTCGAVSLTGGEQLLNVPAGTPINTLFNVHVGVSSPVTVGAGDKITLVLRSPQYYVPIQWSAPNGPGVSSLSILTG